MIFLLIALLFDNAQALKANIDLHPKKEIVSVTWSSKSAEATYEQMTKDYCLVLQKLNARNAFFNRQYGDQTEYRELSVILREKNESMTEWQRIRMQELLDQRIAIRNNMACDGELRMLSEKSAELSRQNDKFFEKHATINRK